MMGHMDSITSSNINRGPIVEKYNNGEQSSLNYKRPSSASSDYNRCSPRSMGSNSANSEERQILQSRKGSKKINPNRNSSRTFSSTNKECQFHINPDPNRQYLRDVQNQLKNWCLKFLYNNQKNMVFDRPKRNGSESSSHFRKIKYDDRQTESSGDHVITSPDSSVCHEGSKAILIVPK
jgi:hypothetical protein